MCKDDFFASSCPSLALALARILMVIGGYMIDFFSSWGVEAIRNEGEDEAVRFGWVRGCGGVCGLWVWEKEKDISERSKRGLYGMAWLGLVVVAYLIFRSRKTLALLSSRSEC